jgi:hypothetical protein
VSKRNGRDAQFDDEKSAAEAELSRMISELNEVRMRVDAIVRKLVDSNEPAGSSLDDIDDVEGLRVLLLRKLDRIREQLVVRLSDL